MFANRIVAPLILIAMLFLYLAWKVDESWSLWIIPFLVIAAVVFIFSQEINWWWYNRKAPALGAGLTKLLVRFCGFYQRLDTAGQQKFRDRVALFRLGTEWTPMGWPEEMEKLPADIELALAAQAVMLTFHKPRFLFEKFEKVIVYPVPFPSPEHPYPHTSELYEEDGCLIFSAEQVMCGFTQPGTWYQVGLHEYARAYVLTYPEETYPTFQEPDIWEKLEAVSGISRQYVESVIGIPGVSVLPVAIHHFFAFPDPFREVLPEGWAAFSKQFSGGDALGEMDGTQRHRDTAAG